ncbi:tyrosine--tRNA ligase [Candidatus Woesearchaeota archaeon]|nr:tyrosine--tRNA ligase [Candidatus Woesearchaeota archaeon]
MDIQTKLDLIKQVGEEIVTEEELKTLLETKTHPVAYDGFEPSGTDIHIAQGLMRSININKMTKVGIKFKMLVADWHAWANNKMGGDLEKIQKVGHYYIEVWKACGMDLKNIEFVWASDLLDDTEYWKTVMQIARKSTLKRVLRTVQIMGRSESDNLQASQIFYPCMQTADIFHLKVDICQLGMDQRKVSMLARELAQDLGFWKPIIISHHMLAGLAEPPKTDTSTVDRAIELKMSKSKPDTAIFMTDSEEDIKRKVKKAWCPEGTIAENPILEYFRYIIFELVDEIEVKRPEKFGGNIVLKSYAELEKLFENKKIHPMDLKNTAAEYINKLIEPIRNKILNDPKIKKMREEIKTFEVTR